MSEMSDWKSRAIPVNPDPDWKSRAQKVADLPEESGILPTVLDKAASGLLGGFSDEASGGLEALGQAAGVQGLGGKFKDMQLSDQGPTTDWDVIKHAYINGRDKQRKNLKQESEDHPIISGISELGGALVSPINKIAPGAGVLTKGAILGGTMGLGNSEADNVGDLTKDTAVGAGLGAGAGLLADKVIAPAIGKVSNYIGGKLGDAAEKLATNSTGATGVQSAKFAPNAGRELLDRGLVRFGDNASNVAARTEGAMNSATSAIDDSLKALDAKGVTASADNVVAELEKKIAALEKDPSQTGVVQKLKGIVDNIITTGESKVKISAAEQTKRGFNKAAGNWMDPEAGQAGKQAYLSYMKEVEGAANAADPALAQKFTDAKKTFGLLAPIQEAAERRSLQQTQSPLGGLGDMAAAATGGGIAGIPGAIAGVIGKKVIAPRLSSSMAVTADAISKKLLQSPQMLQLSQQSPAAFQMLVNKLESQAGTFEGSIQNMLPRAAGQQDDSAMNFDQSVGKDALLQKTQGTKYGQVLQNAASKGDNSLAAAHYVLSNRDEMYRKVINGGQ